MLPRLTIKMIDNMTATELGLLLSRIAEVGVHSITIPGNVLHRILTKAASMLLVDGAVHRYELDVNRPRYSQIELDLMEDWSEVSPEELFGDLDEHEVHKLGYAIAVDHTANIN